VSPLSPSLIPPGGIVLPDYYLSRNSVWKCLEPGRGDRE
jgi:hypothetical protein